MTLDDERIERFSRQIILPEIGARGQERLLQARVLLVGLTPAVMTALAYLAAAGVGEFGVVDFGARVEPIDLAAPFASTPADLGRDRIAVAQDVAPRVDPRIRIFAADSGWGALGREAWDVVLAAGDSAALRQVNRAALEARVPCIATGLTTRRGWLVGVAGYQPETPCFDCAAVRPVAAEERTGTYPAPLATMAGTIGALAAIETAKLVLGIGRAALGWAIVYAPARGIDTVSVPKDPDCASCRGATVLEHARAS
jgi:adenylyltransferase/sulfurtransferase